MPLSATYVPKKDLTIMGQMPRIEVRDAEERMAFMLSFQRIEKLDVTESELDAFGQHVEALLLEHPFDPGREFARAIPYWETTVTGRTAAGGDGGGARAPRVSGPKTAPEGAQFDSAGGIIVPPRSKTETLEQKKFRRACRSYRNFLKGQVEGPESE